jgi:N-acylneuraminate cytidylyltransferase
MRVAIIPARGGSKRIPLKNIRDFNDKPMIAYSIEAALASGCFDKVIVSTDSDDIAAVATSYGAEVPFIRPAELADDFVGTTPVVRHALNMLAEQGIDVDICCCIYATTPLLQVSILREAGETLFRSPQLDYVFSACRFGFPIQRALVTNELGGVMPFDANSIGMRSQDLTPTYHDAGQFYWGRAAAFLDTTSQVFGTKSRMQVLPDYLVADIDTLDDWERAEVLYQVLKKQGKL